MYALSRLDVWGLRIIFRKDMTESADDSYIAEVLNTTVYTAVDNAAGTEITEATVYNTLIKKYFLRKVFGAYINSLK